ncbi:metallophosphoesterase family protein [Agromyces subbeticus]|uniref:metallophosphoesterase family protein n=1 Tax=Agromyces subbeticus TaxID=293890 RepID=UPI0003B56944|nr:metallophosphoesterase [Agromyces subbeticus]
MPTSLVILADTHVPKRARDLPPEVWAAIELADVTIHAGDWVEVSLLDEIEQRSRRVIGVVGNNDGDALRARLPEVASATIDGVRFAVVHETGQAVGRERRLDAAFAGVDVLVFGHSHIPWDTVSPAGMRVLNPGSPTDRRRQPKATFMTAVADAGGLHDIRLIELDPGWRAERRAPAPAWLGDAGD